MSILGTYRASSICTDAGFSDRVCNLIGYTPSGSARSGSAVTGVILGVGLFCWSGSYTDGYWMPLKREWLVD